MKIGRTNMNFGQMSSEGKLFGCLTFEGIKPNTDETIGESEMLIVVASYTCKLVLHVV